MYLGLMVSGEIVLRFCLPGRNGIPICGLKVQTSTVMPVRIL